MGVNRVEYCGNVLIDTTQTTVTPGTLAKGVTAIDKAGNLITGTMDIKQSKQNITPTAATTTATITITAYSSGSGVIEVYKNGFKLDNSEYSISNKTITFNKSIAAGNAIEIVYTYLGA